MKPLEYIRHLFQEKIFQALMNSRLSGVLLLFRESNNLKYCVEAGSKTGVPSRAFSLFNKSYFVTAKVLVNRYQYFIRAIILVLA